MALPKKYLSYSQFRLWKDNPNAYKLRYFYNEPQWDTPETLFGRDIAKALEVNDSKLSHVPRFSVPEHEIKVEYEGVPLLGYIDSFDPEHNRFYEYKTGHVTKEGKVPWDKVKVLKHEQLDFYSLLIELKYGTVYPQCSLIWMETKKVPRCIEFDGHLLCSESKYDLELTGTVKEFSRTIYKYERERIKKEISRVAQEISQSYTQMRIESNDAPTLSH